MYPPHKTLVRPRSSLSTATDDHRLKSALNFGSGPSLIVLSLIGTCAFLFALCVCLICALVTVGKNLARSPLLDSLPSETARLQLHDVNKQWTFPSKTAGNEFYDGVVSGNDDYVYVSSSSSKQTKNLRIPKSASAVEIENVEPEDFIDATLLASERYWLRQLDFINTQKAIDGNQPTAIISGKIPSTLLSRFHSSFSNSKEGSASAGEGESENSLKKFPVVSSSLSQLQQSSKSADQSSTSLKSQIMSKIIPKLTFRLPSFIRPLSYNLWLQPNFDTQRFAGKVSIDLDILQPAEFIPIHSKKLTVTATNVNRIQKDGSSVPIKILQTFDYEPHEYWVTEFEKPLEPATYRIKLSFEGSLTDRIVGFYQSSYFDKRSNQTRRIATSKFEPTYARQAFPCFDEPAMKAKFRVTLSYPNSGDYHALSNMDIAETKVDGDKKVTVFNPSVPMSTYLACFIISDFTFKSGAISASHGDDFSMQVYATPEQLDKVDFALEAGIAITEYYISYFEIAYPLPKLDMVAIPDFVSGAMEHWGLVTFRETALLYHDEISSAINKQRVGQVVAHELAHMWFGNLVTMEWWNDLWLNEGFATYITYKGLNHAYPNWKMLEQFLTSDLHGVLQIDSTLASHPIVQTAESPDQITELFDTITYSKGASIIRMLEDFVTPPIFKQGVTNYLNRFKYLNAVTDDFFTEIAKLVNTDDVKFFMETFTKQMGFPVVNVKKVSNTRYTLTQKRFLSNPSDEETSHNDSPYSYRWDIPITYFVDGKKENPVLTWFKNNDTEIQIDVAAGTSWVKFNKDQVGYYRVNYEPQVWSQLSDALEKDIDSMSISDRGHLLNDVYALADATQLSYDIAFDFMSYLKNEDEFVPWSIASSTLISLRNKLRYVHYYEKYLKFAQNLIADVYNKVGWIPDTDHLKNRLRIVVLETACALNYKPCVQEAQVRFKAWIEDEMEIPKPDLRSVIYAYGVASIEEEETWDIVWKRFVTESDANEKAKLMSALAFARLPFLLQKFVDLAWDQNNVRSQDYFTCLQSIASNPIGEPIVWDYVRGNWNKLVDRFGLNERYLGRMIPAITGRFASQVKLEEIDAFFKKYPEAGAGAAARRQATENVRNNIQWLEGNREVIGNWLGKNV